MIVAKIQVNDAIANTVYRKVIPAGIIGAQVQFDYASDLWAGLHKTVVFRGAVTKDVITDAEVVTIPAEGVAKHGYPLCVGVYGMDTDGNLAIPTIWADLGTVRDAADPSGDTTADPSLPVWAQIQAMIGNLEDLDTTAKNNLVAAVNDALTNGGGTVDEADVRRIVDDYLAANPPTVTESDPTVPAWAKEPTKPTYTAAEVGALPDTYTPPNQTAQQVGADPAGTAASAVSQHNTDAAAHNDLRLALQELANRINAALDSDDTTLDQMSEIVSYIRSNKSLIDAITTSKVSVADIVNDLVTNVADKPLSAAQGVAIKGLIDDLRTMIPEEYTLPIATETTLGGVKPVTATDAMTQLVGVTAEGRLVTKPGEGGSGIAVTGATVGQTVKIAAVDDNGVPTAWEPVDFPSSGADAWELIANGTTGDESTALDITKDNDGQMFELKRWYLRMQISPITVNTDNTVNYLSTFMYTNKQDIKTCQNNAQSDSSKIRYYQCFGEPVPGAGLIFAQSLSTQRYNNVFNLGNMSYYYSAIDSHCFGLIIGYGSQFNKYVFGAGSEYYLYGVRV